jgi:UV DNA damage repair endonuclease
LLLLPLLLLSQVVNERLSPNCKARLTVENDDRASQYSVADLMLVHQLTGAAD